MPCGRKLVASYYLLILLPRCVWVHKLGAAVTCLAGYGTKVL